MDNWQVYLKNLGNFTPMPAVKICRALPFCLVYKVENRRRVRIFLKNWE